MLQRHEKASTETSDGAAEAEAAAPQPVSMLAGVSTRALQRRILQRRGGGEGAPGEMQKEADRGVADAGGALPHLDAIQRSFGRHDVSGVQAHVGGRARDAADAIHAEAYATGNHVAFGEQPDLHTAAHEAAHVVQQREGVQLKGGVGEAGDAHERHADAVADAVVQGRSAEALLDQYGGGGASGGGVQRIKKSGEATPVDVSKLDAAACKEHLARIARQKAGAAKGDDKDWTYDPGDKDALAAQQKKLADEEAEKNKAKLVATLEGELASLATASDFASQPPWHDKSPVQGAMNETYASGTLKPGEVVARWKAFLGSGPYSHKHPRTGAVDATRLVSADGQRSIRYGDHEKAQSTPSTHHFHEETWVYVSSGNKLDVNNQVRRVPVK